MMSIQEYTSKINELIQLRKELSDAKRGLWVKLASDEPKESFKNLISYVNHLQSKADTIDRELKETNRKIIDGKYKNCQN